MNTIIFRLKDAIHRNAPSLFRLLKTIKHGLCPSQPVASCGQPQPLFSEISVASGFVPKIRLLKSSTRPKAVLVLPHLRPEGFSGGPNTALFFAAEIAGKGYDVLCLAAEYPVCSPERLRQHLMDALGLAPDVAGKFQTAGIRETIPLHPGDTFIATHYKTVEIVEKFQEQSGGKAFLYLIQDFEPMFHPWDENHATAITTYEKNFLPVVNEALLADFMCNMRVGRFSEEVFRRTVLTFSPAVDRRHFYPEKKEQKTHVLLFYARPDNPRNLFEFGMQALSLLAWEGVLVPEKWKIWCMGTPSVPPYDLGNGIRTQTLPWMGFSDYAACLRQASAGLSLMLSPHTSYIPLELAACNIPVVTTTYVNKTAEALQAISPWIHAASPAPKDIAAALKQVVQMAENGTVAENRPFLFPDTWKDAFAPIMPNVLDHMEK
ncbi:hypothetical protein LJC71_02030 [Desulfosarcina sp. OttesenSCG-928-A07]|nr:hypothetical protein [Desulfosarcina sp. OttesenSCG-928-A07]